jgi:AcrR family transcriptional regulator
MNNASIHYHFGDKAGLYRELYRRALDTYQTAMRSARIESHEGRAALLAYHGAVLRMHSDDSFAPLTTLHLREESHPSGIVDDLRPRSMELLFEFIGGVVQRELGIDTLDAALRRLVLTLHGTGLVYVIKRQGIAEAVPGLLDGPGRLDDLIEHLADVGMAMIEAERRRRVTQQVGPRVRPEVGPRVVPAVATWVVPT